ncbi:hypothetical protein J3Q64DRAFT_1680806 [Phycomyces blakesleeanus]|uniref:PX domain-containing protein n=1 Tax=Phycomyces blakesleeanus TaxID=4837 RepID=A0ABR3AU88_PHYBL
MPPHLLHPRPSHSQTRFCPGVKLAPPIHHVTIIGFERRSDQKIWFLIDVDPQQADPQNNTAGSRNLARKSYTIARRYEDFSHFSQSLQTTFSPARPPLSNTLVLPKIKGRIQILPNKQIHIQRRAELERFVDALFQLPTSITQSLLVLEFFGLQKADTEEQLWRDQQSSKLTKPTPKEPKLNTSASPSPSHSTNGSPSLRTIKIKVVYDADNIIVIQVPRSIDLKELQQRISQKLADPGMGGIVLDKDPHLLFNHTRSSASSTYQEDISGTDTIIGDQSDWTLAMHTQWHDLDKVTLRCV